MDPPHRRYHSLAREAHLHRLDHLLPLGIRLRARHGQRLQDHWGHHQDLFGVGGLPPEKIRTPACPPDGRRLLTFPTRWLPVSPFERLVAWQCLEDCVAGAPPFEILEDPSAGAFAASSCAVQAGSAACTWGRWPYQDYGMEPMEGNRDKNPPGPNMSVGPGGRRFTAVHNRAQENQSIPRSIFRSGQLPDRGGLWAPVPGSSPTRAWK
jgi:hypothetical protein